MANKILSMPISATPKRGGDLDMRYYSQLRIMSKEIHTYFNGTPMPESLRVGLSRDSGWIKLAAIPESLVGNTDSLVEISEAALDKTLSMLDIYAMLNDAVDSFNLLNPATSQAHLN